MELKNLIKKDLNKKIIAFFHENPSSIDTPRGIAMWINDDLENVKSARENLAKRGILTAHEGRGTTGYSYTRDDKIISRVSKLL